jgi:hypothetical protein
VTIQNNKNVKFTVNVTSCTFENVEDGHKVYLIGPYRGWLLDTDLPEADINWSNSNPNV